MGFKIPTGEPEKFVMGDTWTWKKPASFLIPQFKGTSIFDAPTWVLTYEARGIAIGQNFTITALQDGTSTGHIVSESATSTGAFTPGEYGWAAYVTNPITAQRFRVAKGVWAVEEDLASQSDAFDWRSRERIDLSQIRLVLSGKVKHDQASYSILNRSLSRWSWEEMILAENELSLKVNLEDDANRVAQGLGTNRKIFVGFANP